jgi:hypothetical protein
MMRKTILIQWRVVRLICLSCLICLSTLSAFAADPPAATIADTSPPLIELLIPAASEIVRDLKTIEIHFDEPVQGLEAADLLINGVAATNVTEFGPGQFVFAFPQPADGTISVSWRPDHGITDRAENPHPFAAGAWTYKLDSASPAPDVYVSEFLADNNRSLHDEDGDNSDWIEIFNAGTSTARLNGWFLTDDTNNLAKWRLPDVSLLPNSYLVVFASEKNKTNATGRLHTNFKLSTDGEYLALVSPSTNIVSQFAPAYPKQRTDVTFGRILGAPQTLGYFTQPTPGAPNSASGLGFAPEVNFSAVSANFINPFDLTLSPVSSNAVIRFTLDGNLPTNSSPVYVAAIRITNSVQVRARTFQDGLLPGPPRTETFLLLSNNLVNFTSDLPVVILHSLGKGAPTASRQTSVHLSVYEPVQGVTSLTNAPTFVTRSAIKIRGSSTEGLPKSSFALEFWDEFNIDTKREILGLPEESDWVLYAPNVYDPVLIHNPFIHQLSRDIGQYSSRTRFVEVYLNRAAGPIGFTNYNGIYVLEEKIKIGKNRVDIDKLEPEHVNQPEISGGYLVKIDRVDPGDSGFSGGGQQMAYVDPKEPIIELPQRDPQEQYIKAYFNEFRAVLNGTNWLHPTLGYAAYLDRSQWVDFHIVEVLSGNVDAIVLSTYLHKPRGGKIAWGPHWDFDRALGSTDGRDANPRIWNTGPFFSAWFTRLFRDPDAWQHWADRYQELRRSHLSTTNMHALIDRLANEVRPAQVRERAKWRTAMRGGSYQGEINLMKNWVSNRVDFLDRQFVRSPELSAAGGLVTPGFKLSIAGPTNATIYFTLDGTDPRLPQGELSSQAQTYAGPITLNVNARVVARARNLNQRQTGGPPISTPWSGPVGATFSVSPPPLIVTEIMFHPADGAPGNTNSASVFEFVELKNIGATTLTLNGYRFTSGLEFAFAATNAITELAPGERVLLVKDRKAFLSRYPTATNIAGEYTGSLGNQGNRLSLIGPLVEPIFDFSYADNWQPLADGFGFSLVLADERTTPEKLGDPANWRLSTKLGGSPGQTDPAPMAIPPIFVNELLANPAASEKESVELFNPNPQAADVSGWYLTDDFRMPKKFRLPNRIIPANGYLVVDDLDSSTGPDLSFSKVGEEIYLFSADAAGNLTGWWHGFEFGASEQGVSFGRRIESLDKDSFVTEIRPTLGQINAGPRVGPVVVSEIMFEPVPIGIYNNTDDEFIELRNITAQSVPLFDPARPTNRWRLRGGVGFDFPAGLNLAPEGLLVLVGFDPQTNWLALASFRARYGFDSTARILGPWSGHLNNAGDEIRLLKPGEPDIQAASKTEIVPYHLIDEVGYLNGRPWPTNATGSGLSISRRVPASFGNEPVNWAASRPTPGHIDSDLDGLPDQWEIANGLNPESTPLVVVDAMDDPDGDGFTNFQEFLSGTSPRNAQSYLRFDATVSTGGITKLNFSSAPARKYTLQYRDNLSAGSWQPLGLIISPSTGGLVEVTDISTNAMRFYRLTTP